MHMHMGRLLTRIVKPVSLAILAVLLFVFGVLVTLYSPWAQERLRVAIVEAMNGKPGVDFKLERFSLRWPLKVELGGLSWVQDGDTLLAAGSFNGDVAMLPLLEGKVDVRRAQLNQALYKMGNRDSATCMVLRADTVLLNPAHVSLGKPMNIHLDKGTLAGAVVDLYINPNPPQKPDADSTQKSTPMLIAVDDLDIHQLTYRMNLLPTIDSLGVFIARAKLQGASIDLGAQTVDVGKLRGGGLQAAYIAPDSATVANTVVATPSNKPSAPWTVRVADFGFSGSKALYTTRGVKPAPGLDFAYIAVDDLDIDVADFYNQAQTVKIPLRVSGTERCGVDLSVDGTLDIDAAGLTFKDFALTTQQGSHLDFSGMLGTGNMATDPTVPVAIKADGALAAADVSMMFPVAKAYLAPMSAGSAIGLAADVSGNMGKLAVRRLKLSVPDAIALDANGELRDVMAKSGPAGSIDFAGTLGNVDPWLRMFVAAQTGVVVPRLTLDGSVDFGDGAYSGNLEAKTGDGDLALDGSFNGRGNDYDLAMQAMRFPVNAFMPGLKVGNVTANIDAHGHGFDFFSTATALDADIAVTSLAYAGRTYRDISGNVHLAGGKGSVDMRSGNPGLDFALNGTADIDSMGYYRIDARMQGTDIDLYALNLSNEPANVKADVAVNAMFDRKFVNVNTAVKVNGANYHTELTDISVSDVAMHLIANDSTTNAYAQNGDMYAFFSTPMGLDSLTGYFGGIGAALDRQVAQHRISVAEVQQSLPRFRLDVDAGDHNALTDILAASDMSFDHLNVTASNDSIINLNARVLEFQTGKTRLDTVSLHIAQHGDRLGYTAYMNNRPGTFDSWARAQLDGYFENNQLGLHLTQHNIEGKRGFDIGGRVVLVGDSVAVLHLEPLTPTIAYRPWTINANNFVAYHFNHEHLDANLHMEGAGSTVALYSEHALERNLAAHGSDEDLVVSLGNVHIQDWIQLNPFAPPMRGNLSANMRVNWEGQHLTGQGNVELTDFMNGKQRVGDLRADLDVITDAGGLINTDVALWVNGRKSVTLRGALNDSTKTSPFDLDLAMIHFPLSTVNAFMPGVAKLTGSLNGNMEVTGDAAKPRINGTLSFDSATVEVDMLGTRLEIGDEEIPVRDNLVTFNKFAIRACNDNPLTVNGTVDIAELTTPRLDLRMACNDMLLVDTKRAPKGADVYGRAFVSVDAGVSGTLSLLNVDGKVSILSGTNVTYIIPDATSSLQNISDGDMVKFVNFADTAAVVRADSVDLSDGLAMNIDATLEVQGGSTINVDLDSKGTNRVQLKGQGSLFYTQSPLDNGRLTGRLNINGGFVRYSPPMMGEKLFNFNEGSYVAFNGDMMNPLLNVHAVDRVRANVTQAGQNSRLIYFNVDLGVTGTLNDMNVAFDLATDDDATVANELATMSPQQRASAAMNLLVTNMYTGGDTKGNANLGGNALYSFLTSQLNSWAANTIRGVDLSFGINQYDRTVGGATSQTTQYSYRVSKALFNDRFKIVIGGNYSTDDDANRNLAQNLINDISIEYMLNKSGSMYVRIFRHTGYESILEGEITQTGVGFVYKRRINRVSDMFRWRRNRKNSHETQR